VPRLTGGSGAADTLIALNTATVTTYVPFETIITVTPDVHFVRFAIDALCDSPTEVIVIDNLSLIPHNAITDTDGDGFTDAFEAAFGTNSNGNGSNNQLPIAAFLPPTAQGPILQIPSVPGRSYIIEESSDLTTWTQLGAPITGTAGQSTTQQQLTWPVGNKRYVRVRPAP
jgi:hypothetical protein